MRNSSVGVRSLLVATAVAVLCASCAVAPRPSAGSTAPTLGADAPATATIPSVSSDPSVPSIDPLASADAPVAPPSAVASGVLDREAAAGPTATSPTRAPNASAAAPAGMPAALAAPAATRSTTAAGGPQFALRGVIEGAYAVPFTHEQRASMLTWMAAHGMNTYVHAPKLDVFADVLWRTPYPAPVMGEFKAEIAQAEALGIDWVPALHPGVDLCFSCAADRDALVAKLQPFVAAGSSRVMLGFDDSSLEGSPADIAMYGTGPAARGLMTSDLLNAVQARMPGVDVLTVLAEYTGTRSTPFYAAVASRLLPSIDVFWTGFGVVSPKITTQQAAAIDAVLGRRVVLWDNFPVNDYSGTAGDERRLNLGPSEGLDSDLGTAVQGVLANVQSPWATNTVPLATLADFLGHPGRYDPESSWREALEDEGGADVLALTKLAENSRSSLIDPTESIVVGPLLERVRAALLDGHRDDEGERALRVELLAEIDAARALRAGANRELAIGAARWIDVLEQNAGAALAALDLAVASMPTIRITQLARAGHSRLLAGHVDPSDVAATQAALARLLPLEAARRAAVAVTHGDRAGHPESVGPGNRIDRFVDVVLALPRPTSAALPAVLVDGQPTELDFTVVVADGSTLEVLAVDPSGARTRRIY